VRFGVCASAAKCCGLGKLQEASGEVVSTRIRESQAFLLRLQAAYRVHRAKERQPRHIVLAVSSSGEWWPSGAGRMVLLRAGRGSFIHKKRVHR